MSSGNDDEPRPSKKQKSTRSTSSEITIAGHNTTCATDSSQPQNEVVPANIDKLTKLVEQHHQLQSKVEPGALVLVDVCNKLEPEDSAAAAIRRQKNEDSCAIYKLSNDELKLIFGYIGEGQYGFVACASYRFHQVYLYTFGNDTVTSIRNAAVSISYAQLCLDTERPDSRTRAKALFLTAAKDGQLKVLQWERSLVMS